MTLVSHGEYADGTFRLTNGQTDGRQTVTLRFSLDAASVIMHKNIQCLGFWDGLG